MLVDHLRVGERDGSTLSIATVFPEHPERVFAHWYWGSPSVLLGQRLPDVPLYSPNRRERTMVLVFERGVLQSARIRNNEVNSTEGESTLRLGEAIALLENAGTSGRKGMNWFWLYLLAGCLVLAGFLLMEYGMRSQSASLNKERRFGTWPATTANSIPCCSIKPASTFGAGTDPLTSSDWFPPGPPTSRPDVSTAQRLPGARPLAFARGWQSGGWLFERGSAALPDRGGRSGTHLPPRCR